MEKKLYRTEGSEAKIFGVCGGLAEYLGVDVTIVRLITVLAVLFAGCGLLAYLVAALVMPVKPE